MYYPDLSPYCYSDCQPAGLNVGWLDDQHPFEKGEVDPVLIETLLRLSLLRTNAMRGFHVCELCESPVKYLLEMEIGDIKAMLGSAEIEVRSPAGVVYRAPNLIVHYIRDHYYLPPAEFLEALRQMEVDAGPARS